MSIEDKIAAHLERQMGRDLTRVQQWVRDQMVLITEAEAEIRSLRRQLSAEWGTGYDEGHADGLAEVAGVTSKRGAR